MSVARENFWEIIEKAAANNTVSTQPLSDEQKYTAVNSDDEVGRKGGETSAEGFMALKNPTVNGKEGGEKKEKKVRMVKNCDCKENLASLKIICDK